MYRKIISALLVFAMMVSMLIIVKDDYNIVTDTTVNETAKNKAVPDDTIVIWCTDSALVEYISDAALAFKKNTGTNVQIEVVDGIDYIERINDASISNKSEIPAPDLYITTHDNLMKAYLAGLASPVIDRNETIISDHFPTTALNAITCDSKIVGYPLYYETNFFLYNKTYMSKIAENKIQDESGAAPAEEAAEEEKQDDTNQENSEENSEDSEAAGEGGEDFEDDPMGEEDASVDQEVLERLATMIPSKISDVITFANNYDAPEAVEAVFKWDVTDIFYNYFFVGQYLEVGGDAGDNNAIFNLYNTSAVECLKTYQSMNQYFTIDPEKDNYDSILQDFIDGKLVFTVATTDAFAKIEEAQLKGDFNFDYGVAVLPAISDILQARGLSVTDVIAINGYSQKKDMADDFAAYLSYDAADSIYTKTGKLGCKRDIPYENMEINNVMTEYQKSMPLPKMIETSNFWLQLEIAFSRVWNGEDPDAVLTELSEQMGGQIEEITYSIPVQESIGAGVQTFFTK